MGRWDFLADQKPQTIRDAVLGLVADELTAELRSWPPRTADWMDPAQRARFAPVLERPGMPELDTLRVACELSRLELLREVEAVDRFWRGPRRTELLASALEEET